MKKSEVPVSSKEQSQNLADSTSLGTKIIASRSEVIQGSSFENYSKLPTTDFYAEAIIWLNGAGQKYYGSHFHICPEDHLIITKILCYFRRDEAIANKYGINLNKGLLLSGPIGCGKSSFMFLARYFQPPENRFIIRPCREVGFEFIRDGYETIQKYTHRSFKNHEPIIYCFDDLGSESNLKYFGNDCNVMAEVLLSRYDLFISRKLITHLTTNLTASEMESIYGNRVRSRMRELFNLISFERSANDKRK